MGQRHQLFIITKVAGRYRSLAAVHHQWLYGLTALQQCLRIIRVLLTPANRISLQREPAFGEDFFGSVSKTKETKQAESQASNDDEQKATEEYGGVE